ncbi:putative like-Sm (LSM) domain containing protein, LSm4/SmD1/SmD3 [Helianthus annuus]|nr:putative like-Sm (LSM) domain containing protein, LSm4/SmD1/SmD3 [Helianthus annuus]
MVEATKQPLNKPNRCTLHFQNTATLAADHHKFLERESDNPARMSRSLGIPVKLLHEAAGHIVTVELKSGEVYRGSMIECEDNWNCQLENITFTAKDGKVAQLEHVFIRGSKVRFMIIPDMLKNAPMFKRLEARIKGKGSSLGVGRGRAVAMRARVSITITFHNIT